MDLDFKNIKWMGNIYQKFEAMCQEVDHVVGQDAVKYLGNHVNNVGGGVKNLYSGVVHELLPFPTFASSANNLDPVKYLGNRVHNVGDSVKKVYSEVVDELLPHSVGLKNNLIPSVMPVAGVKDKNKNRDEGNPVNNCIESLQDSNVFDIANDHKASAPIKDDLVNQVNDKTCSDSLEVEDSYITQEEVCNDSGETSGTEKGNLHASIKEIAVESAPELMNFVSVEEKEPLQFSINGESDSGSSDSGCGVLVRAEDNIDFNVGQNSCLIVEEDSMNSSIPEVSNFMSDVDDDTQDIFTEVSPAASAVSCEKPITKTGPLCFESCLTSDSLCPKSLGSYSFEIESCRNNSGNVARSISDSSMVHVCCEPSSDVTGQIMETQDRLVASGHCQSMESNDILSPVSSIESWENIQLNDNLKLRESCVFVDDSELYAVSCRAQKLRSYKKRIQDAFASKKRLAKEYEQLAIWYGDSDIEPSQHLSQTLLPFRSRTFVDPKNLQVQNASETEWELL